jgi:hypothetical protein
MALGADAPDVLRMMLRHGLVVVGLGIGAGLVAFAGNDPGTHVAPIRSGTDRPRHFGRRDRGARRCGSRRLLYTGPEGYGGRSGDFVTDGVAHTLDPWTSRSSA